MAFTYLNSKMIEVPAAIAQLSAQTIQTNTLIAQNFQSNNQTETWQNTYTLVQSNSANWNYQGTDLKELSSNWQSTYETVKELSGNWQTPVNSVISYLLTGSAVIQTLSATDISISQSITVPVLSTSPGIQGNIRWDTNYLYVCVDNNTWKRVALLPF